MHAYQWKFPIAFFCIAAPLFFIGSYYLGREYRTEPSAVIGATVIRTDPADHAKVWSQYEVESKSYELVESGDCDKRKGDAVAVYYLVRDPSHATYRNPTWVWWEALGSVCLGVCLWAVGIHFGLRLQYRFNREKIDARIRSSRHPNGMFSWLFLKSSDVKK
jgi:hypothetical protein